MRSRRIRGFDVAFGVQVPWRHDFDWLHLSHCIGRLGGGYVMAALLGAWVTVEWAP